MPEHLQCLEHSVHCQGKVRYRVALSGTGRSFPRCDFHWERRLESQAEIDRKYAPNSDVPPADFDPTYAGENWGEDY